MDVLQKNETHPDATGIRSQKKVVFDPLKTEMAPQWHPKNVKAMGCLAQSIIILLLLLLLLLLYIYSIYIYIAYSIIIIICHIIIIIFTKAQPRLPAELPASLGATRSLLVPRQMAVEISAGLTPWLFLGG